MVDHLEMEECLAMSGQFLKLYYCIRLPWTSQRYILYAVFSILLIIYHPLLNACQYTRDQADKQ